jgi:hypothetical protein
MYNTKNKNNETSNVSTIKEKWGILNHRKCDDPLPYITRMARKGTRRAHQQVLSCSPRHSEGITRLASSSANQNAASAALSASGS